MQPIPSNSYSVYFNEQLDDLKSFIAQNNYSKIFFLADRITMDKCLPYVIAQLDTLKEYDLIEVDEGEENKNIDFCIGIWNMLLDFGADRNSLLINVGGGVVTDMGSFAAATYKRGIDFVQVPTTLLSQVDASVGGKTGIDLGKVKNIIGTFTQPKGVFISSEFLKTLDNKQLVSGFAEVIKHGLIFDEAYFNELKTIAPQQITTHHIYRSVEIKNEVVTTDPYEKGLRKILNFGHTIGHAIESFSLTGNRQPLLHGEAIAIGMICESYLSHRCNNLTKQNLDEITTYIRSIFPDYRFSTGDYAELLEVMKNDKKNNNGKIGFALLNTIGKCDYNIYPTEDQIFESLDFYRSLLNVN